MRPGCRWSKRRGRRHEPAQAERDRVREALKDQGFRVVAFLMIRVKRFDEYAPALRRRARACINCSTPGNGGWALEAFAKTVDKPSPYHC